MKYIVDRFEEDFVILENMEDKGTFEVKVEFLPASVEEGSVLNFDGEIFTLDEEATKDRRKDIMSRFEKLKNNTD